MIFMRRSVGGSIENLIVLHTFIFSTKGCSQVLKLRVPLTFKGHFVPSFCSLFGNEEYYFHKRTNGAHFNFFKWRNNYSWYIDFPGALLEVIVVD